VVAVRGKTPMTDPTAEEIAFQADLDRLRAHFGMARLDDEDMSKDD
jgi:hypothetical protein